MRNIFYVSLLISYITCSCGKENTIYNGADFNGITFKTNDTVCTPSQEKKIGAFKIDGYGLPLLQIELELEFETWDYEMTEYVSNIEIKDSLGNTRMTADSYFEGGFCKYTWKSHDTLKKNDSYHLHLKTGTIFEVNQQAQIQIAFRIENLFDDSEIIHGASIVGFPKTLYFEN